MVVRSEDSLVAVVLLVCFVSFPQTVHSLSMSPNLVKRISEVVESTLACRRIPGLALSAVSKDKVLLERGFGVANVSSQAPVTEHTLFPIGSTTKAFTSTLLAMLMEKRQQLKLNWSTPIRSILGESFALYNELLTRETTLEDILSHRTGIPDYFLLLLAGYPDTYTRKQLVYTLRYHKPIYEFRTQYSYNNHLYALAGYVAEVLEGRSWEALTRECLLDPLRMTSTRFIPEVIAMPAGMAVACQLVDDICRPVNTHILRQAMLAGPAGSIVSTAHDMAKWMQFHLNGGVTSSKKVLVTKRRLQETYLERNAAFAQQMSDRDLVRPHSPVSDVHVAYDLGWVTSYYRGYKRIWHSGSISTYKSQVWLYPDVGVGLFISTHGPHLSDTTQGLSDILHFVSDLLLGETPWFNSTCSPPPPRDEESKSPADNGDFRRYQHNGDTDTKPERPFEDYVGNYTNSSFGFAVSVTYDRAVGALRVAMGTLLTGVLHYNRTTDVFEAVSNGLYWFRTERLPLRFRNSGLTDGGRRSVVSVLEVPMFSPFDLDANTVAFTHEVNGAGTATKMTLDFDLSDRKVACNGKQASSDAVTSHSIHSWRRTSEQFAVLVIIVQISLWA